MLNLLNKLFVYKEGLLLVDPFKITTKLLREKTIERSAMHANHHAAGVSMGNLGK